MLYVFRRGHVTSLVLSVMLAGDGCGGLGMARVIYVGCGVCGAVNECGCGVWYQVVVLVWPRWGTWLGVRVVCVVVPGWRAQPCD